MKSIYNKAYYHFTKILFERFSIPNIKNENISKRVLKKYLPKNPTIIDCGAHYGDDTVELATILKGHVHAFEPLESIFQKLQLKSLPYKNISCYQIALSDKCGKSIFYISEGQSDASSSLLEPLAHLEDHPETYFTKTVEVDCLTLDEWAKINKINKIDMLWLEMQGFEMNMLLKSKNIFNAVTLIHTEVSVKETYKGVPHYKVFRAFLETKGFKVIYEAIPKGWDMGNVVFYKKQL